jgi:DNA invertase Pin-like site-specific DNA recombinase
MSCATKATNGFLESSSAIRVSTGQQDLTRQVRALKGERCAEIFTDTGSGKSRVGRPNLAAARASLVPGDVLVLAEWDRCTRFMWDGLQIVKEVSMALRAASGLHFGRLEPETLR